MDVLLLCSLVIVAFWLAVQAFWRGADDAAWEMRWEHLDDLDRAWLAAASRSGANRTTLVERGELELAKGFGRREQRRRAKVALATLPLLVVAAASILTGVLGYAAFGLTLGTFSLLLNVAFHLRDRRIKIRYRQVQASYLAAADIDAGAAS